MSYNFKFVDERVPGETKSSKKSIKRVDTNSQKEPTVKKDVDSVLHSLPRTLLFDVDTHF